MRLAIPRHFCSHCCSYCSHTFPILPRVECYGNLRLGIKRIRQRDQCDAEKLKISDGFESVEETGHAPLPVFFYF